MRRTIKSITGYSRIDGVVPGVRGQRAFPNMELRTMDPFVMLDHIGPQRVAQDYFVDGSNSGHPHRGFETITFMFEGIMNHKDSLGNREMLESGSVQRMNAGKGIQHGGDFKGDPHLNTFHEVQLWVNLHSTQKMSMPEVHNVKPTEIPHIKQGNTSIRIISGDIMGQSGPISTKTPTKIMHVISTEEQLIRLSDLPKEYNLLVYVLDGDYAIDGKEIKPHNTISFENDGDSIDLLAHGKGQLLVVAGEPIGEPVVMGGPFVMNTREEIDIAYSDFQEGKFGII